MWEEEEEECLGSSKGALFFPGCEQSPNSTGAERVQKQSYWHQQRE